MLRVTWSAYCIQAWFVVMHTWKLIPPFQCSDWVPAANWYGTSRKRSHREARGLACKWRTWSLNPDSSPSGLLHQEPPSGPRPQPPLTQMAEPLASTLCLNSRSHWSAYFMSDLAVSVRRPCCSHKDPACTEISLLDSLFRGPCGLEAAQHVDEAKPRFLIADP